MRLPSSILLASTALVTVATFTTILAAKRVDPRDESCAIPPGVTDGLVAQHAMACRDLEHGRITLGDYRRLIGLDAPPTPPIPHVQWASSVRAVSSEYTTTRWSAQQVLGAPNAGEGTDHPNAWASLTADGGPEFIEVGFAQPTRLAGLEIFESYNPGAVRTIELIGASGRRVAVPSGGTPRALQFPCTAEPIVGARITLASEQVPGWNELDAIGAVSCQ